ncbi:MAG: hypothetical protein QOE73_1007, partial [Verrucomicrobiota bacterium]
FSAFDAALAPWCFAAVSSGFAAFAPGFVSAACVFGMDSGFAAFAAGFASAPCVFPAAGFSVGVDCSSGFCASAAPASASEQLINKLVNFFILVWLVVGCSRSIQAVSVIPPSRVRQTPFTRHRSPNDTSCSRTLPVPRGQGIQFIPSSLRLKTRSLPALARYYPRSPAGAGSLAPVAPLDVRR